MRAGAHGAASRSRAISLLRDFYEDTTEDAYLMQYRYQAVPTELRTERRLAETGLHA